MTGQEGSRRPWLDAARGLAIILMVGYHGTWDAVVFGHLSPEVLTGPAGVAARTGILGLFLVIAGMALAFAAQQGLTVHRVARRVVTLGLAAGAVTAASLLLAADTPIWFGVLHFLTVASLIALPVAKRPATAAVCAMAVAVAFAGARSADGFGPLFEHSMLIWLGLGVQSIPSLDYVPLIPWLAPLLSGITLGHWLNTPRAPAARVLSTIDRAVSGGRPGRIPGKIPGKILVWMGRHSLAIYLVHQPILIAIFALAAAVVQAASAPLPWR